jgi:hypothetical protein
VTSSTNSGGLRFEARVLDVGPIPPADGPNRQRYLDAHGRRALMAADAAFAAAMATMGAQADSIPTMATPLIEDDGKARVAIQRKKHAEWIEFTSTLDQELLNQIEPHIRRAEVSAVTALNFLEDHELAESAHQAIHRAAFVRRGLFGCPIVLRDNALWTDCAFKLSHFRIGFSTGLVSDFECSICDRLVEDCDHVTGQTYDKVAERDSEGNCTVCQSTGCCHVVGAPYPVVAYGIGQKAVAHEISMVARPRYPQARFTRMTLDLPNGDGYVHLRQLAERGHLHCNDCLGPCKGVNDMKSWTS